MPPTSPSPVLLRGPVFTTPGQGPDLVSPPGVLIGGAGQAPVTGTVSTPVLNLWRQPVFDCAVTPGAGMSVNIDQGLIAYDGGFVQVAAGTGLTIAAADPALDRYDVVVVDGTGTASVITGTAGQTYTPISNPAHFALAVVYVPAGATAITTVQDVRVSPERNPAIAIPPPLTPAQSFAFTFLNTALSNADPGTNSFGFDATAFGSIAHAYINYAAVGVDRIGVKAWLQGGVQGSPVTPWYLRIWSRANPTAWMLFKVSSFTDHSTYCDLALTTVSTSTAVASGISLSTTALDSIMGWCGAVPSTAPTTWTIVNKTAVTSRSNNAVLTADPDLQFAMVANTNYIVRGTIRFDSTSATPGFKFDFDGPASPTRVMAAVWDAGQAGTPAFLALDSALDVAKTLTTAAGGTPGVVHFELIIENGANAGTFSFRWAQNTSSAAGVNVRPGSYLEYLVS